MQIITEARKRVCQNLLNKITVFDQLIDEAELQDDQSSAKDLFLKQASILNKLERIVLQ